MVNVESICKVWQMASSGYRCYAAQKRNPELLCARARRDAVLMPEISVFGKTTVQGNKTESALDQRLSINGFYKAEVVHQRVPWKTKASVELATLEWVSWFNHHRLLESVGYIPPAKAEQRYYQQLAEKAFVEVSLL